MLSYFKFRQDLFDPQPAKDVYIKRKGGRGWPEECPPIRAANAFGFDLLANFDVTFTRSRNGDWKTAGDVTIDSDFDYAPEHSDDEATDGKPLSQRYAWFWDRGQTLPHTISDDVYESIRNQVKLSSFLFLKTDPNELLLFTDVPNLRRKWWTWNAIADTDWYPASYPWHAVIELDPREKSITIEKGEPIARVIPLRRDAYFAEQMSPAGFDEFYAKGQRWLATHGRPHADAEVKGHLDITHTYVKQQMRSRFVVMK